MRLSPLRSEQFRWKLIPLLLLATFNCVYLFMHNSTRHLTHPAPPDPTHDPETPVPASEPNLSSTPHSSLKPKATYNEFRLSLPAGNATTFTINELLDLCHNGESLTITKHYALSGNTQESQYLSNCNPIEISTSQGARSRGHCSDFVQYILYADARLVPEYFAETFQRKMQKCPNSFYLHGEYPIVHLFTGTTDAVTNISASNSTHVPPQRVRNIWMPNWEQVKQEQNWMIRASYLIACKVHITCTAVQKYLLDETTQKQHQNSQNENEHRFANATPILRFMSHSSPDATLSNHHSESELNRYNKFYHAYGHSGRKSTGAVLECWLNHPEWPKLTVIGDNAIAANSERILKAKATNIQLYERVSKAQLQDLQISHGVHLCPSGQEGYGHYINEARSWGAVTVTTHHPPMQEFVEDGVSGILVDHKGSAPEAYQLLGNYETVGVQVGWENVCDAVEKVLTTTLAARAAMGKLARKRYEDDSEIMIKNLIALKQEAEEFNRGSFDGFAFMKLLDL
ncbi:hypothetical protein CcCBS67573_g02236 [Chytriomyces confervae]|uniref:Uncharacterized protein n=1 Tax=Chytriomyces confervae TaxID=246404 RepID=A0A507FJA7_9FUNG|nr:hypothetical protein HDU80_000405 [Chytriomyces hyalinus]TPX76511.1 hypothetical protein CcCBS67573_g02236 [Chytriomyces confervae]